MDFLLPDGYIYRLVKNEENKECIFQIKEINDKNQALKWLQDWSNLTKVTWRINRTYPRSGRHNSFKVDMKCKNAANKRIKAVHTKKTGCTATLQIKIAGFCENIPADQDDFNRDWPTMITIRGTHNHELNSTEAPNDLVHHDQTSSSDIPENNIPTLSADEKEAFNKLIRRIKSGLETKPEIFVPALRKMLENVEKFASTEAGLIRAMHTFGMCNKTFVNNRVKKLIKKSHALRTGVQPTATERTMKYLTGKKKLCARREKKIAHQIKFHNYTTFDSLPKQKREALHNLTDCMYSN